MENRKNYRKCIDHEEKIWHLTKMGRFIEEFTLGYDATKRDEGSILLTGVRWRQRGSVLTSAVSP